MGDPQILSHYQKILRAGYEASSGEHVSGDAMADEHEAEGLRSLLLTADTLADQLEHSILDAPWLRGPITEIYDKWMQGADESGVVDLRELVEPLEKLFGPSRALMIARTECLTAETLVDAAMVRAVYRRAYQGDLVEVVTEHGRKFTATPNHPMLTTRSWISAGDLHESDYLVCDRRQKKPRPSGNEHVQTGPAEIGEIFDSVSAVGVLERRRTTQPDFHGDGMEGDVDVARTDRTLKIGDFAAIFKPLAQQILAPSYFTRAAFCDSCQRLLSLQGQPCLCRVSPVAAAFDDSPLYCPQSRSEVLREVLAALTGRVSAHDFRDRQIKKSGMAAMLESEKRRLRTAASFDSTSSEESKDAALPEADPLRYLGRSDTADVEIDRVLSVCFRHSHTHVYNLSTPHGYFSINSGLYSGNTAGAYNGSLAAGLKSHGWKSVDWIAADDACEDCRALADSSPMSIEEFEAESPQHPNCSCTAEPAADEAAGEEEEVA